MEIPVTENQTVRAFENMECYLRGINFSDILLRGPPLQTL